MAIGAVGSVGLNASPGIMSSARTLTTRHMSQINAQAKAQRTGREPNHAAKEAVSQVNWQPSNLELAKGAKLDTYG